MPVENRSITFTLAGDKKNLSLIVQATEMDDGTLQFTYEVVGKSELRGLFFDYKNSSVIDSLVVSGDQVTNQAVGEESVTNLQDGNNINGRGEKFDVGISFGSAGKGKDITTTGNFVLSATDGTALTLDDVSQVKFGVRFNSQGYKLIGESPATPNANDDVVGTDEDNAATEAAPNANLLANDTDDDGDALTIVAINGDESLVGGQFALSTGALATINSDGSFALDPNGAYGDLAVGETREDSFTYRVTDQLTDPANQGFDTATGRVIVRGVNDAPVISIAAGDSVAGSLTESDTGLATSGTLTVSDIDLSDVVSASVVSVISGAKDDDPALPSNALLHSMLSLDPQAPAAVLDATEDSDTLNWDFNSAGEAFDYLAGDESLELEYLIRAEDDNGALDEQTISITVEGSNDAPVISLAGGDSAAETVHEGNGTLSTGGTVTVTDLDTTDVVTASILSVSTSGENGDASLPSNAVLRSMLSIAPAAPSVLLDGAENADTLSWDFNSAGEAFDYLADGESLILDYTVRAEDDNGAYDDQTVTVTVAGSNDRPVAKHVSIVSQEDAASSLGFFDASDLDSSDNLSYQILGQPLDSKGHQYGEVVNNGDGTFSFKPLDNFQFLDAGESRDVSFQYVAVDDSGTATDTSAARTATVTVTGSDDAPVNLDTGLLFETENQSMWDTGEALIIDWRDFYGVGWDEPFSYTLVNSSSITLLGEVEVAGFDIFPGVSITTPSLSIDGGVSGRVGVSPYFQFNSGSVDSSIPIDLDLTYDVQYEDGDTVRIGTGYAVANEASFDTTSPNITLGLDLVFEFGANGSLNIGSWSGGGSSSFDLFPTIDVNVDEQVPVDGWPTSGDGDNATLVEFSSIDGISSDIFTPPPEVSGGEYEIPIFNDSSLKLSFPYIEATGQKTGSHRLEGSGEDDIAILELDLDDLISEASKKVPPMSFTGSEDARFTFDLPGFVNDVGISDINVEIFDADWDFELIDVDLLGTLTAVQDFTLDIDKLPLMVTLENGDIIDNFKLGDDIEFTVPDWDVDSLGDADGQMDYALDIDMEALFNNWTTLDFSLDLVTRLLKANFSLDTIVTDPIDINLFGDASTGYFLAEETFNLVNESPLAELFGDEDIDVSGFDIIGWNQERFENAFDIA